MTLEPFVRVEAVAAPLPETNIDTDRLVPARFLSRARAEQGDIVFHDLRFTAAGDEAPGFVLNQPAFRPARILLAGRNFGCGSSREAAVWALHGYGFRAVIAPSFGDIFYNNCFKNFILPVVLPEARVAELCAELAADPGATMTVDLQDLVVIGPNGSRDAFTVDAFRRDMLLSGQDELGMTLGLMDRIQGFEAERAADLA